MTLARRAGRQSKEKKYGGTFRQHLPHSGDTHAAFARVEAYPRRAGGRGPGALGVWTNTAVSPEHGRVRGLHPRRHQGLLSPWPKMLHGHRVEVLLSATPILLQGHLLPAKYNL